MQRPAECLPLHLGSVPGSPGPWLSRPPPLASFRKPFLINPGGTAAKPITPGKSTRGPRRSGGRHSGHGHPKGRAAPPSFPSRPARKVRQRLGHTAVLGSGGRGGSYTVGGGTSRPREARGLWAPAPAARPGPKSAGARSGELRQRGWKGAGSGSRPGPLKCWRSERRAPRLPLTGLSRTGAKTVNK
ncbi:hypothetical protein I79_004593 [Cricetulus griseus]|uniref:Uncharacterized protein n=1 Tax=Cricetulus griseus TaxID=10029 RepID=G3H2Y8_CRIGR|nr:hypothetical protein I79_004593 [Cricetulus griseus]